LALLKLLGGVFFIAPGGIIFFFERRNLKVYNEIDSALLKSIKYQGFLLGVALIILGIYFIFSGIFNY
jgi:hypothetical protein